MTDLSPTTVEKLRHSSAASISTQLVKRGFKNCAIRGVLPLRNDLPNMVGPAFTVRYIPAREDLDFLGSSGGSDNQQRQAIERVPAGHVLVFDCRGVTDVAGIGAILARRLYERKVEGVVLDGGVRDSLEVAKTTMPVYCLAPSAPANFIGHHAADYGRPISCGGVAVFPDDIVVGDGEAVMVIPRDVADEVAEDAWEMDRRERFLMEEIKAGRSIAGVYPPSEETLAKYKAWVEAK